MFAGITQGLYEVTVLNRYPNLMDYSVKLSSELLKNLKPGDSVAIDGVCQTVVKLEGLEVSFQAISETLEITTLSTLNKGDKVSVEISLCLGDSIGGHEVSGHIFGTGTLHQKIIDESVCCLVIQCPIEWMKYILPKGFIAVDGSSLTVGKTLPEEGLFYLHLIPETLRLTNFSNKKQGDKVNIELDHKTRTIVDTVENILSKMKLNPV